jgi:high-affinity nickel-transport protein
VLLAVFLAGLRHGFDLDHIAAITDITSSQTERKRAILLGTVYAIGHAVMLMVLGGLALILGQKIPESFDEVMGRVIGVTLILLGVYVLYSLIRYGRDVKLRSRWTLVLAGLRRVVAWIRRTPLREVEISHEHEHDHEQEHHHDPRGGDHPHHDHTGSGEQLGAVKTHTHAHPHSHVVLAPADPFTEYGVLTCFFIGMIHGVGAETPTQVVLFTTAAGVTGALGSLWVLLSFVGGLLIGNSILVAASARGFSRGQRLPLVYMFLALATAVVSLVVGSIYLFG